MRSMRRVICIIVAIAVLGSQVTEAAGLAGMASPTLPIVREQANAPVIRGLRFNPDSPFDLEFLVDAAGQTVSQDESQKLIRYFFAGLTIPEDKMWANLSPFEKDRIVPEMLQSTDLGNGLLEEDFMLKQMSSALTYPETDLGSSYWQAMKRLGDVDIYNRTWIVPESAAVYEKGNTVLITEAKLKAMLEEDYLALQKTGASKQISSQAAQVTRQYVLPALNDKINNSKHFAALRQMYYSLILAQWFKAKLKESFYAQYIDQGKTDGVNTGNPAVKEQLFAKYVDSYQKGVYDYVRTEGSMFNQTQRRYYSGGITPVANLVPGKALRQATDEEARPFIGRQFLSVLAGISLRRKSAKQKQPMRFADMSGFAAGMASRRKRKGIVRSFVLATTAAAAIAVAGAMNVQCTALPTQAETEQIQQNNIQQQIEQKLQNASVKVAQQDYYHITEDMVWILQQPGYDSAHQVAIGIIVKINLNPYMYSSLQPYKWGKDCTSGIETMRGVLAGNTLSDDVRQSAEEALAYLSNVKILRSGNEMLMRSSGTYKETGTFTTTIDPVDSAVRTTMDVVLIYSAVEVEAAVQYFVDLQDSSRLGDVGQVTKVGNVATIALPLLQFTRNAKAEWLVNHPADLDAQRYLLEIVLSAGATDSTSDRVFAYNALMQADLQPELVSRLAKLGIRTEIGYDKLIYFIGWEHWAALDLLGKIGTLEAQQAIINLTKDTRADFSNAGLAQLGAIATDATIPILTPLYHPVGYNQNIYPSYATEALIRIGTPAAQDSILDAYEQYLVNFRATAREAMMATNIRVFQGWTEQNVTRLRGFLTRETSPYCKNAIYYMLDHLVAPVPADTTATDTLSDASGLGKYGGIAIKDYAIVRIGRSADFRLPARVDDFDGLDFTIKAMTTVTIY